MPEEKVRIEIKKKKLSTGRIGHIKQFWYLGLDGLVDVTFLPLSGSIE